MSSPHKHKKTKLYSLIIKYLCWFLISPRIDFQILLLVYKALYGLRPTSMPDLLVPYKTYGPLRPSGTICLVCEAAFSHRAPHLKNKLSEDVRSA